MSKSLSLFLHFARGTISSRFQGRTSFEYTTITQRWKDKNKPVHRFLLRWQQIRWNVVLVTCVSVHFNLTLHLLSFYVTVKGASAERTDFKLKWLSSLLYNRVKRSVWKYVWFKSARMSLASALNHWTWLSVIIRITIHISEHISKKAHILAMHCSKSLGMTVLDSPPLWSSLNYLTSGKILCRYSWSQESFVSWLVPSADERHASQYLLDKLAKQFAHGPFMMNFNELPSISQLSWRDSLSKILTFHPNGHGFAGRCMLQQSPWQSECMLFSYSFYIFVYIPNPKSMYAECDILPCKTIWAGKPSRVEWYNEWQMALEVSCVGSMFGSIRGIKVCDPWETI